MFSSILCAVDGSALTARVLSHALGLANLTGASLSIVTFVLREAAAAQAALAARVQALQPAGVSYADRVTVRALTLTLGQPADAILDEARGADLIVIGTHSRSGLSRWLLGSTSAALLEQSPCPTWLVPPGDLDVITLGSHGAHFHPGSVLAAVALDEQNDQQLVIAAKLAELADQPLVMMTVAAPGHSDATAIDGLQAQAARAGLSASIARVIVARGDIPTEIDRVAVAQHAGLVVLGLRASELGTPGAIASAVLHAKDAIVLTVPASRSATAGV